MSGFGVTEAILAGKLLQIADKQRCIPKENASWSKEGLRGAKHLPIPGRGFSKKFSSPELCSMLLGEPTHPTANLGTAFPTMLSATSRLQTNLS